MSGYCAEAVDLGKCYWTGARTDRTLLGRIRASITGRGGLTARWAVRHASFALEAGRSLAVIGPNGSGKSTLLMMLAGLIPPGEGRVAARGRVGSFLSPGAGLYPQLGVVDNLRLLAALYGMTSRDLAARLDEIVAFGELEPYLDSRLGELSAGYQARLIFSMALHAPFDVLIFDEIFAVGDAAFAGRCLERLRRARKDGAAVALATHDLDAAAGEFDEALYLDGGHVAATGPATDVVKRYKEALSLA